MIITAFFKALSQLPDPRFRKVLLMGIGLTIALLIGTYAAILAVIEALTGETTTLPGVGEVTWVGDLLSWGSLGIMIVLSVFLMVPVASAITSLFLDDGREYFQLAAMRRIGREAAKELRAQNAGTIWLAGCLMAVPLSFPLINLIIPLLGAATFTHLFHRLNRG